MKEIKDQNREIDQLISMTFNESKNKMVLPSNFASRVTQKAVSKESWKLFFKHWGGQCLFIGMLLLIGVAAFLFGSPDEISTTQEILVSKGVVIGSVIFLIVYVSFLNEVVMKYMTQKYDIKE
ncbi:hypothetical protein K5X82_17765 [Halosquirtibacter xylanolyticus]|uniref:hypothetical protein n=1 Tax=Halosquirtibacter xylanolyticus TaxID=3374599 RepID=UPI0037494583|nr:hypothetical protein K5X82_17765 [Prolixibacteraceae bacterium]